MKCSHCGQEHPDDTKFCPMTGKKMGQQTAPQALVCQNPDCDLREPLPLSANYCPNCGKGLGSQRTVDNSSDNNGLVLIATKDEDGVYVFNPYEQKMIYSLKNDIYDSDRTLYPSRYSGHDYLELDKWNWSEEKNVHDKVYDEISIFGIRENLDYKDLQRNKEEEFGVDEDELCESMLQRFPQYTGIGFVRRDSKSSPQIFIGWYPSNLKKESPVGADVINEEGALLFKIDKYVPGEASTLGIIAVSLCGELVILDYQGNLIMKYDGDIYSVESITDDLYKINDDHGDIICLSTKEVYDGLYGNMLYKLIDDQCGMGMRIFDSHTKQPLYERHDLCNSVEKYPDGWLKFDDATEEYGSLLFSHDSKIYLKNDEIVVSDEFYDNEIDYERRKLCIGDGIIITSQQVEDYSIDYTSCVQYNLRDYYGTLIARIESEYIFKGPFRYGKAIAVSKRDNSIVYFDKQGKSHKIHNVTIEDDPLSFRNSMFFVSENKLVVNDQFDDGEYSAKLMNLNGDVIFSTEGWMEDLSSGFIKVYFSGHYYGVINLDGEFILKPKYDEIIVLH